MPLWNFGTKDSLEAFREACKHLAFDSDTTTTNHAPRRRIQGPDAGHQNDTGRDATRVLDWLGSMRNHHKPSRIQQLVKKADPSIMQYAANVRDNY